MLPQQRDGDLSLKDIPRRIRDRHAFVHERILGLIVKETELHGSVSFAKRTLARKLGCNTRSVDRAVMRLRKEGLIQSVPVYSQATGAQLGNSYKATERGIYSYMKLVNPNRLGSKRHHGSAQYALRSE